MGRWYTPDVIPKFCSFAWIWWYKLFLACSIQFILKLKSICSKHSLLLELFSFYFIIFHLNTTIMYFHFPLTYCIYISGCLSATFSNHLFIAFFTYYMILFANFFKLTNLFSPGFNIIFYPSFSIRFFSTFPTFLSCFNSEHFSY